MRGLIGWWARVKADPEMYAAMRKKWSRAHMGKRKSDAHTPAKPRERNDPDWFDPVTFSTLRNAKTKPRGCSDIRWRIELGRRRMAARHPGSPNPLGHLPDPDTLP